MQCSLEYGVVRMIDGCNCNPSSGAAATGFRSNACLVLYWWCTSCSCNDRLLSKSKVWHEEIRRSSTPPRNGKWSPRLQYCITFVRLLLIHVPSTRHWGTWMETVLCADDNPHFLMTFDVYRLYSTRIFITFWTSRTAEGATKTLIRGSFHLCGKGV